MPLQIHFEQVQPVFFGEEPNESGFADLPGSSQHEGFPTLGGVPFFQQLRQFSLHSGKVRLVLQFFNSEIPMVFCIRSFYHNRKGGTFDTIYIK
jgi:hypothetical protein